MLTNAKSVFCGKMIENQPQKTGKSNKIATKKQASPISQYTFFHHPKSRNAVHIFIFTYFNTTQITPLKTLIHKQICRQTSKRLVTKFKKHILKHIFLFASLFENGVYLYHKPKTIFFTLKI